MIDQPLDTARDNQLKFAAKIWKSLPAATKAHMAAWLAIAYRGPICAEIRRNGHCPKDQMEDNRETMDAQRSTHDR